jgi:hypothetical protein
MTTWPIRMKNGDFSLIENTRISRIVLKSGKTITFDKNGGQYVRNKVEDTLYTDVVGSDLSGIYSVTPTHEIVSVEGEYYELNTKKTVAFVGLVLICIFGIALFVVLSRFR